MTANAHHRPRRLERLGQDHADHQGDAAPDRARPARLHAQARASRLRPRPAGQGFVHAPPRRRDRGGDQLGQALRACCTSCATSRSGTCRDCSTKLSPVDLVLVEGFKRDAFPKLEIHRAANGKPLLHPDDPHIVAIASRHGRCRRRACRWSTSTTSSGIVDMLLEARGAAASAAPAMRSALMAQLTDDCFAFSGPAAADRRHGADDRASACTPVAETETRGLAAARGRVLAADVIAPLDLPPFDNSAVDGYAVRHARSRRRRPRRACDRRPR